VGAIEARKSGQGVNQRNRTLSAAILLPLAGLIAVALAFLAAGLWLGSLREDANQTVLDRRLVDFGIDIAVERLSTTVVDFAWRDGTAVHLGGEIDADWADRHLGEYLMPGHRIDGVFVLGEADRTLYGWLDGARTGMDARSLLGPGLAQLTTNAGSDTAGGPLGETAFLATPGGTILTGVARIMPESAANPGIGPAGQPPAGRRLLVLVRRDGGLLDRLTSNLDLPAARIAAYRPGTAVAPLLGPEGRPVAAVVWNPETPGRTIRRWLLPALAGACLVFVGFAALAFRGIAFVTAALRHSEHRFRDIVEAASDWIWETDSELRLTFVSARFGGAASGAGLGRSHLGQPLHAVLSHAGPPGRRAQHERELAARRTFRDLVCRVDGVTGGPRTVRVTGRPAHDHGGRFSGYRGIATDITAELEAQAEARYQASHDPMTGLANRVLLNEFLAGRLAGIAAAGPPSGMAVMCVDLDAFKPVNDTLGHAAGDELIRQCARRLLEQVPEGGLVARLGGDEFVVVAPEPAGREALALADRLIRALKLPQRIDGHTVTIGASIGIALMPADGADAEDLLRHADRALYRAKAEGRSRACLFGADAGADAAAGPVIDRRSQTGRV
jgi:diguanylate cyclase (GGDEF)-like protein/PAS domain S-box-containing protein